MDNNESYGTFVFVNEDAREKLKKISIREINAISSRLASSINDFICEIDQKMREEADGKE